MPIPISSPRRFAHNGPVIRRLGLVRFALVAVLVIAMVATLFLGTTGITWTSGSGDGLSSATQKVQTSLPVAIFGLVIEVGLIALVVRHRRRSPH
jgi:hypothetical protein